MSPSPSPHGAEALAARIDDGALIALAPDYSGCALAVVRELIRRGARGLRLVGCPQLGLQAELLVAGGCVEEVETAAFGLGELGRAPAFDRALRSGGIRIREATCPAIHAGLQAAEKGVTFLPLAGVIGSDLISFRPDWKVQDDPFSGRPVLLVPAIRPDITLFHAPLADEDGNVWIGIRRELMLMAHAARRTLASVETRRGGSLLTDEALAAGTLPALYVERVETIEGGASPGALFGRYPADGEWIAAYAEAARSGGADLTKFLDRWLAEP
ncbi:MAG: CoA synthetase [Geminicoccaceae bacterium]|nr:CoA synthetase [Geminicoccaceae bacterium]